MDTIDFGVKILRIRILQRLYNKSENFRAWRGSPTNVIRFEDAILRFVKTVGQLFPSMDEIAGGAVLATVEAVLIKSGNNTSKIEFAPH